MNAAIMPTWSMIPIVFVVLGLCFAVFSGIRNSPSSGWKFAPIFVGILLLFGFFGVASVRMQHSVPTPPMVAYPRTIPTDDAARFPTKQYDTVYELDKARKPTPAPLEPPPPPGPAAKEVVLTDEVHATKARPKWVEEGIAEETESNGQRVVYITVATDLFATVAECERALPTAAANGLATFFAGEGEAIDDERTLMQYGKHAIVERYNDWNLTSQGNWVKLYARLRLDATTLTNIRTVQQSLISETRAKELTGYAAGVLGILGIAYGALKLRGPKSVVDAATVDDSVARNEK